MAVQVLRLLQEDVVEDPGDVDGDVVLYGLKHRHVGPDAGEQLTGLRYLLSGLVVHGHPHYGPKDRGSQKTDQDGKYLVSPFDTLQEKILFEVALLKDVKSYDDDLEKEL